MPSAEWIDTAEDSFSAAVPVSEQVSVPARYPPDPRGTK